MGGPLFTICKSQKRKFHPLAPAGSLQSSRQCPVSASQPSVPSYEYPGFFQRFSKAETQGLQTWKLINKNCFSPVVHDLLQVAYVLEQHTKNLVYIISLQNFQRTQIDNPESLQSNTKISTLLDFYSCPPLAILRKHITNSHLVTLLRKRKTNSSPTTQANPFEALEVES
jgi:hypothetical protein